MKIVVIGGGVAGLAIGWRLVQSGANVTILERAQAGRGATWASAGMIAATAELENADSPESEFAHRSGGLWPIFAAEIEQATGAQIHYRQSGALIAAANAEEAARLQTRGAGNLQVSWLEAGEAKAFEPLLSDACTGALWAPGEAIVDNRALGRALEAAFVRGGGTVQAAEPVVKLEIETGRAMAARTPFRTYEAEIFIVAAGAWSGGIPGMPPEIARSIRPVKGEMIALEQPASAQLPGHVIWGNGVYIVPRRNRLLIGATVVEAGFDTSLTDKARDWLRRHAEGVLPALSEWQEVEHWSGLRPGSADDLPLLGATSVEGLYAATGQYRNGILFAPAIAEAVSRLVLDRRTPPEIAAFDPRRFV